MVLADYLQVLELHLFAIPPPPHPPHVEGSNPGRGFGQTDGGEGSVLTPGMRTAHGGSGIHRSSTFMSSFTSFRRRGGGGGGPVGVRPGPLSYKPVLPDQNQSWTNFWGVFCHLPRGLGLSHPPVLLKLPLPAQEFTLSPGPGRQRRLASAGAALSRPRRPSGVGAVR